MLELVTAIALYCQHPVSVNVQSITEKEGLSNSLFWPGSITQTDCREKIWKCVDKERKKVEEPEMCKERIAEVGKPLKDVPCDHQPKAMLEKCFR